MLFSFHFIAQTVCHIFCCCYCCCTQKRIHLPLPSNMQLYVALKTFLLCTYTAHIVIWTNWCINRIELIFNGKLNISGKCAPIFFCYCYCILSLFLLLLKKMKEKFVIRKFINWERKYGGCSHTNLFIKCIIYDGETFS